jgi:hypothetical protein
MLAVEQMQEQLLLPVAPVAPGLVAQEEMVRRYISMEVLAVPALQQVKQVILFLV